MNRPSLQNSRAFSRPAAQRVGLQQQPIRKIQGNVVLLLLVVSFVVLLIASTVANQYVTIENDAIERHISEVRGHWAMVGTLDFILSRLRQEGRTPLADTDNNAKLTALTNARTEINGIAGLWLYDTVATGTNDYTYSVNTVIGNPSIIGDGRIGITLSLNNIDAQLVPVLVGLANRMGSLVIELCAGDQDITTRTVGGGCETIGGLNPLAENGISTLIFVERGP